MNEPNWLLEISKITVPVVLGALIWSFQALAQRAWSEYEKRRELYLGVVRSLDALLTGGSVEERREYLRAVRSVWIGGSDEVVRASNRLSEAIVSFSAEEDKEEAFRGFIETMRRDLRKRRWLPPGNSTIRKNEFPIEGPRI